MGDGSVVCLDPYANCDGSDSDCETGAGDGSDSAAQSTWRGDFEDPYADCEGSDSGDDGLAGAADFSEPGKSVVGAIMHDPNGDFSEPGKSVVGAIMHDPKARALLAELELTPLCTPDFRRNRASVVPTVSPNEENDPERVAVRVKRRTAVAAEVATKKSQGRWRLDRQPDRAACR
jgi:hypothetical protein